MGHGAKRPLIWLNRDQSGAGTARVGGVPSIDRRNSEGQTPLLAAAWNKDASEVKRLLAAGADPLAVDATGASALCFAAPRDPRCCALLIAANSDLDSRRVNGDTALFFAAGKDKVECLRLLVAAGADIDARNQNGETALMRASWKGSERCARVLLSAGADAAAQDYRGLNALAQAERCEQHQVIALLQAHELTQRERAALSASVPSDPRGLPRRRI